MHLAFLVAPSLRTGNVGKQGQEETPNLARGDQGIPDSESGDPVHGTKAMALFTKSPAPQPQGELGVLHQNSPRAGSRRSRRLLTSRTWPGGGEGGFGGCRTP